MSMTKHDPSSRVRVFWQVACGVALLTGLMISPRCGRDYLQRPIELTLRVESLPDEQQGRRLNRLPHADKQLIGCFGGRLLAVLTVLGETLDLSIRLDRECSQLNSVARPPAHNSSQTQRVLPLSMRIADGSALDDLVDDGSVGSDRDALVAL